MEILRIFSRTLLSRRTKYPRKLTPFFQILKKNKNKRSIRVNNKACFRPSKPTKRGWKSGRSATSAIWSGWPQCKPWSLSISDLFNIFLILQSLILLWGDIVLGFCLIYCDCKWIIIWAEWNFRKAKGSNSPTLALTPNLPTRAPWMLRTPDQAPRKNYTLIPRRQLINMGYLAHKSKLAVNFIPRESCSR